MEFRSILYGRPEDDARGGEVGMPAFFVDLGLDQIVDRVTAAKAEYGLVNDFYLALSDPDAVRYRQDVVRDLESEAVFEAVRSFASGMRTMRGYLAEADGSHYRYQRERWFLDAVAIYCNALRRFVDDLGAAELRSHGFMAVRDYLGEYTGSQGFVTLDTQTRQLQSDLASIQYNVLIHGNSVKVRRYASESDYSARVLATFDKFKEFSAKDYRAKFSESRYMNHVEAQVLDAVAKLYPEIFSGLDSYCDEHANYLDERVATFDREVQFYVAYLEHMRRLQKAGLQFCLPEVERASRNVFASGAYDLALADKLVAADRPIIDNDFQLEGGERILVVTGPNQGGKTTFARTFGQLHYLAALGLPVPARHARLHLFDGLFAHFERQEHVEDLRGKLHEELLRVHGILEHASPDSIIIMNEAFSSTTANDALLLNRQVLERIERLDAICLVVTFLDELASLSEKTVSMVSTVDPADPTVRTFKIVRKPADGRAYAVAIARKYGLTREALRGRLGL